MDLENRIVETGYSPEDSEVENPLRPVPFLNILGRIKRKPEDLYRGGEEPQGTRWTMFCCTARLVWGRQPGGHRGNEMGVNLRITSGPAIEAGRSGGAADEPEPRGRPVYRRSAPAAPHGGRNSVSRHGGLRPGYYHRKGQMAASYHLPLPHFTLIGATPGRASSALFGTGSA